MPESVFVLPHGALLLAAGSSLVIAIATLLSRRRGAVQWGLALGMAAFAAEALAAFALLAHTEMPADRLLWLQVVTIASLLTPMVWGLFAAAVSRPDGQRWPLGWRLALGVGSLAALAVAGAVVSTEAFQLSDIPGPFYAGRLGPAARSATVLQILWTVGVLAALEARLWSSRGVTRWRIKYFLLGLGGIFLVRFFLLSQLLLFGVLMGTMLTTSAATVFIGNVVIGAALARDRLLTTEITVSRRMVYRSVVTAALGVYLTGVGLLSWLLDRLGIAEQMFWGSVAVFLSALAVAAVLLSESVRWRIKRFIGANFYRSKYDYRQEWAAFTKRLGALVSIEELAPEILGAVTDTIGAVKGTLHLREAHDTGYRLAGAVGVTPAPAVLPSGTPLLAALERAPTPLLVGNGTGDDASVMVGPELSAAFPEGSVAVPLRWRGALTGVMLVGPERAGSAYTPEDLEFLGTVGEQAAGVLAGARLSEAVAQAREFEAFHRLTSFVIHDLKNSISALSLLSQNALAHFDEPDFQRDAIKTLSRTVDRMKALLARLSSAPEAASVRLQPLDVAELAREATDHVAGAERIALERSLAPVPLVNGDADALLRVIQNLITNAIEALDGAGAVTVGTHEEAGAAVVTVTDTGCGIPEEFLRKSLFAPFKSTKKGGWGIGLYQARAIVEAHGGTIEVASRQGEGTTFRIRLPALAPRREGSRP